MPAKIRLARHGRKKSPYYHIVISDSRAPRDGRYIERIGIYNPGTNPATIKLDFDRALEWLQKGAQPTDTCRAILSYKGVLFKNHLLNGVKKGAFSEDEAEVRYNTWLKEKENEIQTKKSKIEKALEEEEKKRFEAEKKIKETKPKVSPYKEKEKWSGYMPIYGDIAIGGSGRVIGTERFINDAKICSKCNDNVERALDKIKKLFE